MHVSCKFKIYRYWESTWSNNSIRHRIFETSRMVFITD
nr:MAG TPA: hypothetical protein [Caudoviricetes sp.]